MGRKRNILNRKSILKATALVVGLTLVSKALGFLKSIIQASYFGATIYTDAYNIANGFVSNILFMLVTAISVSFVPLYIQSKQANREKEFATKAITFLTIGAVIVSALLIAAAPPIITIQVPSYSPEQKIITIKYFRVLVLGLIFALNAYMFTSVLNAEKIYGYSAVGSVVNSLTLIVFTFLFAKTLSVWVLVISMSLSYFIQWMILYIRGRRYASISLKYGLYDEKIRLLLMQSLPILLGQATVEINQVIDRALLLSVGEGVVTAVSYSAILNEFVIQLMGQPIQTVLFTELSEAGAAKDTKRISSLISNSYKIILIIGIPIVVVMLFGSYDIVRIVYGHGKFSAEAVKNCAVGLQMYSLCLLPVCIKKVLTKAYYAQNDTRRPMIIGVFEVLLNIGLSVWWVRYWGVYGVVGATAAASFTFIIVMLADYNRKYDCVLSIKEIVSYWNIIVGTIIVMITMRYFSMLPINSALLSFVCKTAMAFLVFYLSLIITGEPSFIYVLQKAMQIIKRKTGK